MPHIILADDLAGEVVKFTSAFATVEANQAAGVYPVDRLPAIEHAKAKVLEEDDHLCDKLKAARLKFQTDCGIAEPE